MFTSMVRRPVAWLGCVCLLILVCAFAACGSSNSSTTSGSNSANTTSNDNSANSGNPISGLSTASSSMGTVSSASTSTSAGTATSSGTPGVASTEKMTVTIKENKSADGKDTYIFDPTTITLKKGDTLTVQNTSDKEQYINEGDAAKAGVDATIAMNKSGTMTFNKVGTFDIKSTSGAAITVTVQDIATTTTTLTPTP